MPTVVHLLTEDALVVLTRGSGHWVADYMEHGMGRCLMEPMPYDATLERPFGSSRISRSVMSITDDAIRQRARMEVASEAATLPQAHRLPASSARADMMEITFFINSEPPGSIISKSMHRFTT